jgi:predicted unusual protein kinase regulating ubiquinone biosynthesis (AarF/ABC1/UbiB family)
MPIVDEQTSVKFPAGIAELSFAERAYRFVSILTLAARSYLGYKSVQLWTRYINDKNQEELYRRQNLRAARSLYETAVRLEGLLIKASQFIGTRADILPDEWVKTLSLLHDKVPPRSFDLIRNQIEREMRRALSTVYSDFNPLPIASASLAQVHEAYLKDGRRCAVKVQYPGIESRVRADLRNLLFVLRILARLESNFDFTAIMREVLKYIPMELDFLHEAHNAEAVRNNFAGRTDVLVPEVYWEFTTRRVLTMEFMEGIQISNVEALDSAGIDKHAVAQKLTEVYCEQILRDGFFQADPHPGNILVQPGPKLVLLDFGLSKDFPPRFRDGVVRLTFAILMQDRAAIAKAFEELGFRTRDGSFENLASLSDVFVGNAIKRQKAYADQEVMDEIAEELPRAFKSNPIIEIPGDVLLISRVMGLLSGLGKTLDSKVNLMETMMPYAQKLMLQQGEAAATSQAGDSGDDQPLRS